MPSQPEEEFEYVRNAGDRKQLKQAAKITKDQQKQWEKDLLDVLSTPGGLRVIHAIISRCKTFESIWHPSALIHYQAGQQDLGHWLMAEVNDVSPETLLRMLQANRRQKETE